MDVWDKANSVSEDTIGKLNSDYFGQVRMDVWSCALVKGQGKVPFDPAVHQRESVAIDMYVDPLPETGLTWSFERHMVEFEPDWYRVTKPSALECQGGVSHIRELPGKWVRAAIVETGETYTNKNGEVKPKTAIKILRVYSNQGECATDYLQSGGVSQNTMAPTPAPAAASNNGSDKSKLLPFLKVIVQNACRGENDVAKAREKVMTSIAGYPMISNVFTVDSEETVQYMMEMM